MADVTIQIPLPVLTGGSMFKYRYREYPAGAWSGYATTTDQFVTITGLTDGVQYQLDVDFVTADEVVCPSQFFLFTAYTEYCCVEADLSIYPVGDNYRLSIDWFYNCSPFNPSPCGYTVAYGVNGGTLVQQSYITLPPSPIIYPVGSLDTYQVIIYQNTCDGRLIECFKETVDYVEPVCTPGVISGELITYASGTFLIRFNITQSSPVTQTYYAYYQQVQFNGTGSPDAGGMTQHTASPVSTNISFPINPNTSEETIYYDVVVTDKCGSQTFTVEFTLT